MSIRFDILISILFNILFRILFISILKYPLDSQINILLDRCECVIQFLAEQSVTIEGVDSMLHIGQKLWDRIQRESVQISSRISPIMRAHRGISLNIDIYTYSFPIFRTMYM